MTAQEIADRFQQGDTTDSLRIKKLEALCVRSKVELEAVIRLLPRDVQDHLKELH